MPGSVLDEVLFLLVIGRRLRFGGSESSRVRETFMASDHEFVDQVGNRGSQVTVAQRFQHFRASLQRYGFEIEVRD